ncbi:MAG: LemA family protein [Clostridiaceae bacterium]|nr:LemA family protein [Clostridiaceae bacterium]
MGTIEIVLIVAAAVLLLLIIWAISTGNRFRRMAVKIDESESGIDVALTKRYDTLTKMLEVVRQYAAHEVETLTGIVSLRTGMSMAEREKAAVQMDEMTDRIRLVAEQYPQLRAAEVFSKLQDGIQDAEAHLQAARRFYNANVSSFNQLLVTFPSSLIGNLQHQQAREFFETEPMKRADLSMKL